MFETYLETFMEIYNAGAAFILVFLIGQILYMLNRVNKDVLKARIFLNDEILQKTWLYISLAGAAYAVHSFTGFVSLVMNVKDILYLYEITQIIFLITFIITVYNWYVFLERSASRA